MAKRVPHPPVRACVNELKGKQSHIYIEDNRITNNTDVALTISDLNGVTFTSSKSDGGAGWIKILLEGQKNHSHDMPSPDSTLNVTLQNPSITPQQDVTYVDDTTPEG